MVRAVEDRVGAAAAAIHVVTVTTKRTFELAALTDVKRQHAIHGAMFASRAPRDIRAH